MGFGPECIVVRWNISGDFKEECSSALSPAQCLAEEPGGHSHDHRALDVRGPFESDPGPGLSSGWTECKSVGGVSQQDLQLQDQRILRMVLGRHSGRLDCGPAFSSQSTSLLSTATAGPVFNRSRQLELGFRAQPGDGTTYDGVSRAPTAQCPRWRKSFQQTPRSAVGGNMLGSSERTGGVRHEEASPGKDLRQEQQRRCRRGEYGRCEAPPKGQAKSQGGISSRESKRDLNGPDGPSGSEPFVPVTKLPGSGAATIRVYGFLNSLPRLILQSSRPFRDFLLAIVQQPSGESTCTSAPSSSTWPCPLPYPEVFKRRASSRVHDAHLKRLVCLQVAALDWLFLGSPSAAPMSLRLGTRLSARQWSVVKMLEFLAVDRNFPEFVEAGDMGRSAGKVEDFQECVDALARAAGVLHAQHGGYSFAKPSKPSSLDDNVLLRAGRVQGRVDKDPVATAKPLVASRLIFPPPPEFDPRPFFDEATLDRYEYPVSHGLEPSQASGPPPRVQVRASRTEKLELYKKLAQSGRLGPVPSGSFHPGYTSGLFAVPKDQLRDRMVLDGRPANLLHRGQNKWCKAMASAATLSHIRLREGHVLTMSGEDLKDFFYQFVVNHERMCRNTLCQPLSLKEAKYVFGEQFEWPESVVQVGLTTLAMGDTCAVEYAQCSHVALCLRGGVAEVDEMLSLHGSIPRGLLQVGIVVDDLVILEQVLRQQSGRSIAARPPQAPSRLEAARASYASAHLINNPAKGFEAQVCARFWGLEIDGDKGLLRASSLRLWPICFITMRIVSLGLSTVGLRQLGLDCWSAEKALLHLGHYL